MIAKNYLEMLQRKSVIREMAEASAKAAAEIGAENVFDYTLGNPSVPAPPKFTEIMVELLTKKDPVALHGYSPSLGIREVKEAVAQSLNKRFGMSYKGTHIFMTNGAAGALAHALRCVVEKGDEVITFAPFFPEYVPYVTGAGGVLKVVPADTNSFQINFDELEKMLNPKVMAILINTPNNPSGMVYATETIKKLAEILKQKERKYGHDIYIISDEPYREIIFAGVDSPYISRYYDKTLSCYSYSKSLSLPGERIGYVAVNPACRDAETMVAMCGQISRGIGHNCPASIIQLAVSGMLYDTSDLSVYEANKNILYKELTRLGFSCVEPGGTFYIFPRALEEDAVAFCKKAVKYHLYLVPGNSFGVEGYFRMSYCISTEKVKRSIQAFEQLVKEYH